MSVLIQLVVVVFCGIGVVAAVGWGVCDDRSEARRMPGGLAFTAEGRSFRRVPVANCHRLHGRHRA
ncbi:hypothetical protein [Nocardia sp. NPDC020380]|uniref:hypothetical protein n=1 Tax=Nocardia sp. NPDC020380 TaxID=3364309 RepID=UPI00378E86F2